MRFSILGPLQVTTTAGLVPVGGPRHRRLLSALLVTPGEVVSTDRLMDILWSSSPPASAHDMVHVRVSEIRRSLRAVDSGTNLLVRHPSGYAVEVADDAVDATLFRSLTERGRHDLARGDPERAARHLRAGLELWRSEPLPELADCDFAQPTIAELSELRLQAAEDAIQADLALGRHREAVGPLRALLSEHPLRERMRGQLMVALYCGGRQSEALDEYDRLRNLLADALGVDPSVELQDLRTRMLRHDPDLQPSHPDVILPRRDNLPRSLTRFVGRAAEASRLDSLLAAGRLVTIVGVGGVGKSRLAIESSRSHASENAGGVWLVDLAPVSDATLLQPTVAHVLDVPERSDRSLLDQLIDSLRNAPTLLVFDNCDLLVDDVAALAAVLLHACARLRILCTSRERLQVTGEVVLSLDGLAVDAERADTGVWPEAVQLFAERAESAQSGLRFSGDSVPLMSDICRRLDGVPLAIELAASRVSTLGLKQISDRLDDRFRLLDVNDRDVDRRHRTLSAVVEWSFDLLSAEEQEALLSLGVFVGGFALEAAEAVCSTRDGAAEVAEVLARLVDKSLVQTDRWSPLEYRYRLLETMRDYARAGLHQRGLVDVMCARHAAYFAAMAGGAAKELRGDAQGLWLDRLEREHDNLRAAMTFCLGSGRDADAAAMAAALYPFWDLHGHYSEGRQRLQQVLDSDRLTPRQRAPVLMGAATLAAIQGDLAIAGGAAGEAADVCRRTRDAAGLAHALSYLGFVGIGSGDLDGADTFLDEAVAVARGADARWEWGWALLFRSIVALSAGRYGDAVTAADLSDEVTTTVGDPELRAWNHLSRACAWVALGDHRRCAAEAGDGLRAFADLGGVWGLTEGLLISGILASRVGRVRDGPLLLGAAAHLAELVGPAQFGFLTSAVDSERLHLIETLGRAGLRSGWNRGAAMERSAAVALALRSLDGILSGT
ncbi:BTAD domain-containing putative transcriptional regulator [Microbacterium lushaniae]|nr:BTAD domain-containing putative transcriptional regulator [Microbacterium lushaniae]